MRRLDWKKVSSAVLIAALLVCTIGMIPDESNASSSVDGKRKVKIARAVASPKKVTYDRKSHTPKVTVYDVNGKRVKSSCYTVSGEKKKYKTNSNGDYDITVKAKKGKGYKGTAHAYWMIVPGNFTNAKATYNKSKRKLTVTANTPCCDSVFFEFKSNQYGTKHKDINKGDKYKGTMTTRSQLKKGTYKVRLCCICDGGDSNSKEITFKVK